MGRALLTSPSSAARLDGALAWLSERKPGVPALLLGANAEAVADLARSSALARSGASFGWTRATLRRFAVTLASPGLAAAGLTIASSLTLEALWARVVSLLGERGLGRFAPVADRPGLPRALMSTVEELRLAQISLPDVDADLAKIAAAFERELTAATLADRAVVLKLAIAAVEKSAHALVGAPLLLLDAAIGSALEARLVAALSSRSKDVLATVPEGDDASRARLEHALEVRATRVGVSPATALGRLQQELFGSGTAAPGASDEGVSVLSAPGESSECVELARRIHREAAAGVPFDRMAILLRAAPQYRAHLHEALRRAGIPAHFAQGTRNPDPSGRAFLALLSCASEGLSARRFAEYLSLGEVPPATEEGAPPPERPPQERFVSPDLELFPRGLSEAAPPADAPLEVPITDPNAPVIAGALRAPRRWEQILVDAAVIGSVERWERRLDGYAAQLDKELALQPEEHIALKISRHRADLQALRTFAMPLIQLLADLPHAATWGEWLTCLGVLADRALRRPDRVLALLGELSPMAPIGPVGLAEVRAVLSPRLAELITPPTSPRFGKVFVAPFDAARGLSFEVVFVPGLAERIFPARVIEDPVLLDAQRERIGKELVTNAQRVDSERLALRLCVGAASKKVVLSYPRLDAEQSRPRVPSFYGLEALRAAEGRLPGFDELARRAESGASTLLGWPAPRVPADAIDDAEHDLALLGGMFREGTTSAPGGARYLVDANKHLGRALRFRARRWIPKWTPADGLVDPIPEAQAALTARWARPFSPTALQTYASCPYRFVLQAVHRLEPREEPEPIEEMNPLQRGSFVHEVLFELLTGLRADDQLPVTEPTLESAMERLEEVIARVAAKARDDLAPAIDRVWEDGVASVRADVREWLRQLVVSSEEWLPYRFELSFGLPGREAADPDSRPTAVDLDYGIKVRGSIDLVERRSDGALRATDYKTGKARAEGGAVVGGGEILQPVLYSLVLEKLFPGARVEGGRLHYCTQAGNYQEVTFPLDDIARTAMGEVAKTLEDALLRGFLPAAPKKDACTWCDYKSVCGPNEEQRVRKKRQQELAPLKKLRELE